MCCGFASNDNIEMFDADANWTDLTWGLSLYLDCHSSYLDKDSKSCSSSHHSQVGNCASHICTFQGGRTWQNFDGGKNGHENFRQACIYNFATNASFLCVIANLQI